MERVDVYRVWQHPLALPFSFILDDVVSATIRLTRDRGFADFSRRYKVMVSGIELGHIKNGGVFECQIPPGKVSLQLRVDWCGSNTLEFDAHEDSITHLECGSSLRGWKIFSVNKVMREPP